VELGTDGAQRQVRLGGEEEAEQAGAQVQAAVRQPQADLDGNEGDGRSDDQLKGERRQERQPGDAPQQRREQRANDDC
jgi:hypothetical protein